MIHTYKFFEHVLLDEGEEVLNLDHFQIVTILRYFYQVFQTLKVYWMLF